MTGNESDFKVVDKRASSGNTEEPVTKQGETFTAKDAETASPRDVDFSALCLSLATGAMIAMGLTPDPNTKKTVKNLEMAKQNIQILELLQKKTKGNLTSEEDQLVTALLMEVRLRFVEASKS